jgi:hypothetical protein
MNDNLPIVVIGNKSIHKYHFFFQLSPKLVYLLEINNNDNLENYRKKIISYKINKEMIPLPSTKYIIEASNPTILELILYKLKYSEFWNINAFFLIKNIENFNSCNTMYSFINIVWKFNILNVIFICRHLSYKIGFYTYNPYNEIPLRFWKKNEIFIQENGLSLWIYMNLDENVGKLYICSVFYLI